MKISLLLVCVCFVLSSTFAQSSFTIKGIVNDPSSNSGLEFASISLLNSKDSILYKYTQSNANGEFVIDNVSKGKYMLLISYPDFTDYTDNFNIDTNQVINFGKINLISKAILLNEVIIKGQRVAIKIKGDTTEYNASSFTIQPNDRVEDLLIQFPGIEVDKNGRIKAQGQTVNKVLVDGAEFFSDDPTLVTKNIRADMVNKVQFYDKKSDEAELTGVDDGKKTKTLNVVLKEDKKHGYFGKLEGGDGSNKLYQTQLMFNLFKDNYKWSVYGIIANTGKIGLEGFDSNSYGVLSGANGLDYFDGKYRGEGIPIVKDGGIHYDNKWNNDKQSVNINYKIGSLGIDGSKNILIQNNLPTGTINSNSDQTFNDYIFRQKLDGIYQIKLSTTSTLKITLDAMLYNSDVQNSYITVGVRGNNILLNTNNRTVNSDVDGKIFNSTALWTKELKKKGRTFSISLNQSINGNYANGYLISKIEYYNSSGVFDSTQNINQFKVNNIKTSAINSTITYSEPLSNHLKSVFNYTVGFNSNKSDHRSYNQSSANLYNVLDSTFSNNFALNQFSHGGGFILNYSNKKTILNLTAKAAAVKYKQIDNYNNDSFDRTFINWNPEVSYIYTTSQNNYLQLKYSGNTVQPNIDQLQPIKINIDPLNIVVGNPYIDPSFSNQFNVIYSDYKVLTDRYFNIYGTYTITTDPITTNVEVDSAGKSTYQFVNFPNQNSTSYNVGSYFGQKIKSIGTIVGITLNATGSRYFSYINNETNLTNSAFYSATVNISKGVQKKFNINGNFGPNYNINKSSLQGIDNNSLGFNGDLVANVFLPAKFKIRTEAYYRYRGKTDFFNKDFSQFILNTTLSKAFLKNNDLLLSISGYDLFNQNRGFDRSITENRVTQSTYTNIKRYFLLSITWDFNKTGNAQK